MARKGRADINVNMASRSMVAMDIEDTSVVTVTTAGTAVAYAQKTEAPFLVMIGDKSFYFEYGDETASSTNGLYVPADTYVKVYSNVQRVGRSGLSTFPTFSMNATTKDKFDATAAAGAIDGIALSVSATTNIEFSAANTINSGAAASALWGAWLIQVNAAGTYSTKPSNGLTNQIFATEQEAIDFLPDVDSGNVRAGYVTIQMTASNTFTCNTTEFDAAAVNDVNWYSFSLPSSASRGEAGRIDTRGEGVPADAIYSRIGASISFDAPANTTKIWIAECW